MNFRNNLWLCVLLVVFSVVRVWGQQTQENKKPIISASPTTAALGKYGEIPVNNYNGMPNIDIPLYEINSGSIKLPISLSYHASGVKVDEKASWAGIGWSLNAGGVITRSIRGIDDFAPYGYLDTDRNKLSMLDVSQDYDFYLHKKCAMTNDEEYDTDNEVMMEGIMNGWADGEADIFFFNVNGLSGKFVLDRYTHDAQLLSGSAVKIEMRNGGFYLYAPDGTTYTFEYFGESTSTYPSSSTVAVQTAWYVNSIKDINGDKIEFEYDMKNFADVTYREPQSYYISRSIGYGAHYTLTGCGPNSIGGVSYPWQVDPCESMNSSDVYIVNTYIYTCKIKKIKHKQGEVVFIKDANVLASLPRADVPGDVRLSKIEIYNLNNLSNELELNKTYTLSHNYNPVSLGSSLNANKLWLHKIEESSTVDNLNKVYQLEYYHNGENYNSVPSGFVYKYPNYAGFGIYMDAWGYSNMGYLDMHPWAFELVPQVRTSNPKYLMYGTLKKIIYPTGGYSLFEFESNTFKPNEYINNRTTSIACDFNYKSSHLESIYDANLGNTEGDFFYLTIRHDNTYIRGYDIEIPYLGSSSGGCEDRIIIEKIDESTNEFIAITHVISSNDANPNGHLNQGNNLPLLSGKYRVKIKFGNCGQSRVVKANFYYYEPINEATYNEILGGGIRIKSITNHNGIAVANKKTFSYVGGQLMTKPSYIKEDNVFLSNYCLRICGRISTYCESYIPLNSSAQGAYVGYDKVTIANLDYNNNKSSGQVTFSFYNAPDVPEPEVQIVSRFSNYPIPLKPEDMAPLYSDPKNGEILQEEYWSSSMQPIKKVERQYSTGYSKKVANNARYRGFIAITSVSTGFFYDFFLRVYRASILSNTYYMALFVERNGDYLCTRWRL